MLLDFKNVNALTGQSLLDSRATLHLQGADVVDATLHDVLAG